MGLHGTGNSKELWSISSWTNPDDLTPLLSQFMDSFQESSYQKDAPEDDDDEPKGDPYTQPSRHTGRGRSHQREDPRGSSHQREEPQRDTSTTHYDSSNPNSWEDHRSSPGSGSWLQ